MPNDILVVSVVCEIESMKVLKSVTHHWIVYLCIPAFNPLTCPNMQLVTSRSMIE